MRDVAVSFKSRQLRTPKHKVDIQLPQNSIAIVIKYFNGNEKITNGVLGTPFPELKWT